MKVQTKVQEFEAHQYTGESHDFLVGWARLEQKGERWVLTSYVDGYSAMWHPLQFGDWIVKYSESQFDAMSEEVFEEKFNPSDDGLTIWLSRDEVFWLASCHLLTVMIADGRDPAAVSKAYEMMKTNGKDLGTKGVNELFVRISMLVQARWPDSTTFVFADPKDAEEREDSSPLHGATLRIDPNVS